MFPGQHKAVELTPLLLKEPVEMSFIFSGGPFDGHRNTATVRIEMDNRVTVIMSRRKKKYLYRYAGNNTFNFEGNVT